TSKATYPESHARSQPTAKSSKQQQQSQHQRAAKASTGKPETMYESAQAALEDMVGYHQPRVRPTQSYPNMIRLTLLTSKTGKMCLSELYEAMADHFPWFKTQGSGWKNSIRHNLSINSSFLRTERPKTDDPSVPKGSLWFVDESVEPASVRPPKPSARGSGSASKTMRSKLVSAAEAGFRSSSGSKSGQSSGGKIQASIPHVDATESDRDAEGETDVSDEEMSVVARCDPPGGSIRPPATEGQRATASGEVKSKATPSATPSLVSTPASTPGPAVDAPQAAGGPATLPPALPQQTTTLSMTSRPSLPMPMQDGLAPPQPHLHQGNGPIRSLAVAGLLPLTGKEPEQLLFQGHAGSLMLRPSTQASASGAQREIATSRYSPELPSQSEHRQSASDLRDQTSHENAYFRVNPFAAQSGPLVPPFGPRPSAIHPGLGGNSLMNQALLAPSAPQFRSMPLFWTQPHSAGMPQMRPTMPSNSSNQLPAATPPMEPHDFPPHTSAGVFKPAAAHQIPPEISSGQRSTSASLDIGSTRTTGRHRRSSSPEWADPINEGAIPRKKQKRQSIAASQTVPDSHLVEEKEKECDQRTAVAQELLALRAGTPNHAALAFAPTAPSASSAPGSTTTFRSLPNV
ncbi:hypothetical protein OC861_001070, partial [Tilletia horrida]